MIQDLVLRWIVTALFVLSAAECLFGIAVAHRARAHVVGHLLHFTMSVAMAVMAWPWGAALPTTGPMVFFLLAAVWFVAVAITGAGHRIVNGYHTLMMLAMAWMYATMNNNLLPGRGGTPPAHQMPSPHTDMPGMDMNAVDASPAQGGYPVWVGALNGLCTIVFATASLWWIYRYVALRKATRTEPWHRSLDVACQAMMAAGMAIMFGVML